VKKETLAWLALVIVNVVYGLNYVVSKEVMPVYMRPEGLILLRVTGAAIIFWLLSLFFPREKVQKKDWGRLWLCAIFGVCTNQLLFFAGLNLGTPINAAVMMTSNPVIVLLAAWLTGQEKLGWLKGLGVVLGGSGALLLILQRGSLNLNGEQIMLGNLLVLLNSASYAIYILISKPLMQRLSPLTVIKWIFTLGWFLVLPFGYTQLAATSFGAFPSVILWDLAFIVVGVTGVTYLFNIFALKYVNPSLVSIFIYLQPLVAGIHALWLGKDQITGFLITGSLFIFSGVYLVSRKSRPTIIRDRQPSIVGNRR
jgi:drug/metabolite transporter (DMT)-like permease